MSVQRGFTLIEMLVVMSLMALVMLGLTQAVRTMGQTETRVDSQLERIEQIRIVEQLLEQAFSRMDATLYPKLDGRDGKALLLQASQDGASWVGVMPARPGLGGRYFLRLTLQSTGTGQQDLVLQYLPWQATGQFPAWDQAANQTLVHAVLKFEVEWQGMPLKWSEANAQWPSQWVSEWTHTNSELPQRARFFIADEKGPWPPIVVQIWPTSRSLPTGGGFVAGGKAT